MKRIMRFIQKRSRFNKKKNNILFTFLVALICLGIGYAYLSTELSVVGTTNVDASRWDVHFVQDSVELKEGSVEFTTQPTVTDYVNLSFGGTLENPGDYLGFDIDLVNEGTLDATLDSIEISPTLTEDQQKYFNYVITYGNGQVIREGDPLFINESKTIKVFFEYIESDNTDDYPDEDIPFDFDVNLDYIQSSDSDIYLISYDCTTNGGNSCNQFDEYKRSGSTVTLPNEVGNNSLGYQFAGWINEQGNIVNSVTVEDQNVNLTATYGSSLSINYQKGEHVSNIGKTTDTCILNNNETSCNVTLPSITADSGYGPDGWYKDENKVGDANQSYVISQNETLTAMAQDSSKPVCSYTTIPSSITYNSTADFVLECSDQQGSITVPTLTTSHFTTDNLSITNISSPTAITNGYQWTITTKATTGTGSGSLAFKANIVEDNNGNKNNSVSASVSLAKITPVITLSATSGSAQTGNTVTFTESANVAGTFTNTSGNTSVATVSPSSYSGVAANTAKTVTVTAGNTHSSATITVKFTPTDTANYNNAANKTYAMTSTARSALYVSSSGSDSGYGTIASPYATVQKAYNQAASTSTIYLMSNITPTSQTSMSSSKTITLTSCTKSDTSCSYSTAYSMIRGNSLTGAVLYNYNGTLTLSNVTIDGNNLTSAADSLVKNSGTLKMNSGATIKNNKSRGVSNSGTFTMTGGTITNNVTTCSGGGVVSSGIFNMSGGTISSNTSTTTDDCGGGGIVITAGTNTISGSASITGNKGAYGGGVMVYESNTKLNITGGTISSNISTEAGGGLSLSPGTIVTMSGGSITGNSSTKIGGGIRAAGTLTITGGTISSNTASTYGGGINIDSNATFVLSNATISNNTATNYDGGGINVSGTLTLNGGATISSNKAPNGNGGGVKVSSTGSFTMNGSTIKKNTAKTNGGIGSNGTFTRTSGSVCKNNSPTNSYDTTSTTSSYCV